MFIAKKKNLETCFSDSEGISIETVKLSFVHHYFICEIEEYDENHLKSNCVSTQLISNLEGLVTLAKSEEINKTYLVSPGYMNKTEEWSLQRLLEISRAEYFSEGSKSFIYRFLLGNGQSIDFDISGLNKGFDELSFESFLNLAEA